MTDIANLTELGQAIDGSLGTSITLTIANADVAPDDVLIVVAAAPSVPAPAAPEGTGSTVTDSEGNTYGFYDIHQFEAFPPNVNEGVRVAINTLAPVLHPLTKGVSTITATWDHQVYDRMIAVWKVSYGRPAQGPFFLNSTPDSDAAVRASNQVTLTTGSWTPNFDFGLMFALLFLAYPIGGVAFGGVGGFNGFYQARFYNPTGSKQSYLINWQTNGADALVIASASVPPYEVDIGRQPANVTVPPFNGVGQFYSVGAGNWKGIILYGID